ncbi:MetS family NSS transporter small subunit [Aquibacillus kalidii]|nr:MetS family NSS transporter small subunit [Aquibacillus kalidii]
MSASAITMAIIGVVIIWGGLIASITHAVKSSK